MKKFATLLILSMAILFTFNVSKGCDSMAIGYDPKIGDYSNQIYSMGLETSPQMKAAKDKYMAAQIKGDTAGMQAAHDEAQALRLSAGYTADTTGSNFSYVEQTTPTIGGNATQAPVTDPYAEMLTQYQAEQQRLADAQRQSRISALGKAKDSALSGLEAEKATIDPYYYDKRNEAASASDVGAMNFAQYMAGRGIKGSAGAMPEMYRNAGLQSQVGKLNTQQAAEHSDIARRKSGIQSAYESDVAGANADIDAQTMQNYINQMQTVQAQRIADMAAQGKTSTGQLNLQGQNAQNAEYERQAALLAAQYYDDIKAEIDRRAAANPNDPLIPYLHSARRQKIQTQAEQQASQMAAASEAEQTAWKNALALFESTGRITSPEQAQILGLPANATAADVDIARMNAATSRMNAGTAQTNAANSQAQHEANASTAKVKQYASQIDQLFGVPSYNDDKLSMGKTYDPVQVKAYIQNLNQTQQISDAEAMQLLALYNFSF